MKCIIYIPLPTNKVVLYNYVHSIFVKWLLNFVCILFRVSCIAGQRILKDPLPYVCVCGRTQCGILYGECKREFRDPLQFWWKVGYSDRLIQHTCFSQTERFITQIMPVTWASNSYSDWWSELVKLVFWQYSSRCVYLVQSKWRTEGGVRPPLRNSEGLPKSCQTQPDCENC